MKKFLIEFKEEILFTLMFLTFVCALVICISVHPFSKSKDVLNYSQQIYNEERELEVFAAKNNLVGAVDAYICSIAPTSTLNGLTIVDACDEYNIDIKFVLAQAQLESQFGTKGIARKTNSVFNVYAYDGLKHYEIPKKGKYKHPDHSVRPYLELLNDKYLVNGKTEYDMMVKYIDSLGHRYATASNYEKRLFDLYQTIDTSTNITNLSDEYKKHKILYGEY